MSGSRNPSPPAKAVIPKIFWTPMPDPMVKISEQINKAAPITVLLARKGMGTFSWR